MLNVSWPANVATMSTYNIVLVQVAGNVKTKQPFPAHFWGQGSGHPRYGEHLLLIFLVSFEDILRNSWRQVRVCGPKATGN